MFRSIFTPLFAAAMVAMPTSAWSWGKEGHQIVGKVADMILERENGKTIQEVRKILGTKTLRDVAIFADCAKGFNYCQRNLSAEEKAYTKKNKNNHSFHYTDAAYQQGKYVLGAAGTGRDDVVQIISYAVKVLSAKGPVKGPASLNKREALWVLAHLVGDIHQPLHVASIYFDQKCEKVVDPNVVGAGKPNFGIGTTIAETTGGNDLMVGSKGLHSFWDSTTVDRAMSAAHVAKNAIDDYAKVLVDNPPTGWETTGKIDTWSTQWANEIMPLGKDALTRVTIDPGEPKHDTKKKKPDPLDCLYDTAFQQGYEAWATGESHKQLGKAGFRLAAVLRRIFENK